MVVVKLLEEFLVEETKTIIEKKNDTKNLFSVLLVFLFLLFFVFLSRVEIPDGDGSWW